MQNGLTLDGLIRTHGGQIAKLLGAAEDDAVPLQASEVRRTENCFVIKVERGASGVAVKAFEPDAKGAAQACEREIGCQVALSKTGLIPPILSYSRDGLLVISTWQDGVDLRDILKLDNLAETAKMLGGWYRRFTGKIASRPLQTNWYDYLLKYRQQGLDKEFAPFATFLRTVEIHQSTIAKNDAHLSNFISDPQGKLIGIDFEEAAIKPVGWDILLTARVLHRLFPKHPDVFMPALMEGWGEAENEAPLADFTKLAGIFARSTAFKAMD